MGNGNVGMVAKFLVFGLFVAMLLEQRSFVDEVLGSLQIRRHDSNVSLDELVFGDRFAVLYSLL